MRVLLATPYRLDSASGVAAFVRFLVGAIRQESGVAVVVEPHPPGGPRAESNLRLAIRSCLALLRHRRDVEVVHCQQFHPQTVAVGLLGRILGKGVVFTVHGRSPRPGGLRGPAFDAAERIGRWVPHEVVFVANSLLAEMGGRGRIVPNGVPAQELRGVRAARESLRHELGLENAFVIAFVGRVTKDKGVVELVEVFRQIRLSVSRSLRLLVVGPLDPTLSFPAAGHSAAEDVLLLGFRSDARRYVAASDLFVLPSHREGLPLGLLEAMAMGLPVVATAVGDVPEVVRDRVTGVLVPPRDPDRLRTAVLWVMEHEADARGMGDAAATLIAEGYDESRVWREYRSLYGEVVRAR